jgi:hypothetical protein
MDVPAPKPAQVVCYAYLWADEHAAGNDEGSKNRPVAIVLAVPSDQPHQRVAVVPITHSPPSAHTDAIEIPAAIKRHLGLDEERSWVVLDELNVFQWPGPDLRSAGVGRTESVLFGYLPAGFFRTIRDRVAANIRKGQLRQIPRTE